MNGKGSRGGIHLIEVAMNKRRRQEIQEVINEMSLLEDKLNGIMEDEQDYLYNIPENLTSSIKYEEAEETVNVLNEAIDLISEIILCLEEAKGG